MLLGQPLDIGFEIRYEGTSDESAASCLNVEVLQGETRMDPARLRLSVETGATPGEGFVRLRSSQAVDEAVLSVILRAGCNTNATRRYDFLVDFPSESRLAAAAAPPVVVQAPTPAAPLPVAPVAPAAPSATGGVAPSAPPSAAPERAAAPAIPTPAGASGPRPAASPVASRSAPPRPVARPAPARPAVTSPGAKTPSAPKAAPAPVEQRPRLVLTPAEGVGRPGAALKSSAQLAVPPGSGAAPSAPGASAAASAAIPASSASVPAQRAQAEVLWRALNADPADLASASQKTAELEAANRQLREQMARNEARFNQLMARLEQMETQRTDPNWLYGLGGLALVGFGLAAWFGLRGRGDQNRERSAQWWQPGGSAQEDPRQAKQPVRREDPDPDDDPILESVQASIPGRPAAPANPKDARREALQSILAERETVEGVDVDVSGTVSQFDRLSAEDAHAGAATGAQRAPAKRAAPSQPAALASVPSAFGSSSFGNSVAPVAPKPGQRAVDPEDLFDLQQHADFFVSLGQYDQAIDVLRKHIAENESTSPLAYLDLLKIYHTLSRTDEFNKLRARFQNVFNARLPAFNAFHEEGRSLDSYPDAIADLQAFWPSAETLEVIEDHLFRSSAGAAGGEGYDLAAYRDLLTLYSLARAVQGGAPADESAAAERRGRLEGLRKARAELAAVASASAAAPAPLASESAMASMSAALTPMGGAVTERSLASETEQVKPRSAPSYVDIDLDLGDVPPAPPSQSRSAAAADSAYEASILAGPSVSMSRHEMPSSPLDDLEADASTPLPEVSLPTNFSSLEGSASSPPTAVPVQPVSADKGAAPPAVDAGNLIDFDLDALTVSPVKKSGPPT